MKKIEIDFEKSGGLVPVIVQDSSTLEVLMLAYMNSRAFEMTCREKIAHYWSRSKQRIWKKGEQSGHIQRIKEIRVDCDRDTILLKVEQEGGAACHTGFESCFHNLVTENGIEKSGKKIFNPERIYGGE